MPNINIASLLKSKRKESGLSVREVVDQLATEGFVISEKTLYGWESGHRKPDSDTFLSLCKIYGIQTFEDIDTTQPSSSKAQNFASEFDRLDIWGQKAVEAVLRVELERCSQIEETIRQNHPNHI